MFVTAVMAGTLVATDRADAYPVLLVYMSEVLLYRVRSPGRKLPGCLYHDCILLSI